MMRFALFLALICALAAVTAADHSTLSGTYRVGGSTFYDPPSDEPRNTHLYFDLTGSAARELYDSMATAPKSDECTGPNTLGKVIGRMRCNRYENGKHYRCWFGIDVQNQKITRAVVC